MSTQNASSTLSRLIRVSRFRGISVSVDPVELFKNLYLSGVPVRGLLISAWLSLGDGNASTAKTGGRGIK